MRFQDLHYKATVAFILITVLLFWSFGIKKVFAADLEALSDQMSRMKESVVSNHTFTFTSPTGVAAGETITITFPTGFDLTGILFSDMDLEDDSVDLDLAAVPAGAVWGAAFSGQIVTFTSGSGVIDGPSVITVEIGTNALYQLGGVNQITNQTVVQNGVDQIIAIGVGNSADTGSIAVDILAEDQISVTADVDPSISFTIGGFLLALGKLTTSSVSKDGPITLTLETNATNGYSIYVQDIGNGLNPGLFNVLSNYLIDSADADLSGTSGYGGQCTQTGGDGACDVTFPAYATDLVGGFLVTSDTYATYGAKPSGTEGYIFGVAAKAPAGASAGSYADTIILIATAIF